MKKMIRHYYRLAGDGLEHCFNIEMTEELTEKEFEILFWLLSETFDPQGFNVAPFFTGDNVVEVGPRLNYATPWNTNALSILRACGIDKVTRIERSRRYANPKDVICDRMTEIVYEKPLATFETGIIPEAVYTIPLKEKGPDALADIPGISMDAFDRQLYYDYFVKKCGCNPTIVEIMDLNNANSEHSRHGYFRGIQIIDGKKMPKTLMELVKSTLEANNGNSVLAFCDNSSAITGYEVITICPSIPGESSAFVKRKFKYHILFTAETHNFPSGVAPFPGAETGTGGRIRDVQATGRGGLVIAGTAAYCVGNLLIPGYDLPWEDESFVYPKNLASPLEIEIKASNGASDYGNKFGEPVIQGFTRSFGMRLSNGERCEWLKPIMFTGGIGQIEDTHLKKEEAETGMAIVRVGGPAYRIGFGGGAASSLIQGEQAEDLDFNAVQRGDAEMEQKMNRVIRTCIETEDNPIVSIHDQGAGGPANVIKELVEKMGGYIDIRKINVGDPTMSVLEIWVCEFQEGNALLIRVRHLEWFMGVCKREKVSCEVLGSVTGDGKFVVHDAFAALNSEKDRIPVNLHLTDVLGNMPQKTFSDTRIPSVLKPLELPKDITVLAALKRVLRLVSVGSKRFLSNKVDRSVTGLVARQQCVGPLQLPLSDVAVIAQSHFGLTGAATAIGERPLLGLINSGAQGRMTVAEMLTNIVWAKLSSMEDIKCSGNWMWAPKLPGEGAKLYDTDEAACDLLIELGVAIDGGKDSLSMATKVEESGELVKSPGQLVLSGYCTMPDITKVITPDIKRPGKSHLYYIDLSGGNKRLGGSALAQVYGQIGDESPDVDDPKILKEAFLMIQEMIGKDLILAGHDKSDGGLITTILEMLFAGNCGALIDFFSMGDQTGPIPDFFNEEMGLVIEVSNQKEEEVIKLLNGKSFAWHRIGFTTEDKKVVVYHETSGRRGKILNEDMRELRQIWEETSYQLERLQCNPKCAEEERKNIYDRTEPQYQITFTPGPTSDEDMNATDKPKVAIIREEGSNGDREMTSAFYQAGFECHDVTMTDLLEGKVTLDQFRGIAFVGGFSYADVLDSAKGWAGTILFNENLKKQFDEFYNRPDTFSLGVCNGCQLMALLGWVPWRGIEDVDQPRFIRNESGRFESRWSSVRIFPSPSIMLKGMEGSVLGVWIAHGEGRLHVPYPDNIMRDKIIDQKLAPIRYVDDEGNKTMEYPFNPNGSCFGITALCSPDGRHLAMMPHPERAFLNWQWGWMPEEFKEFKASPWLKMFQNAREWCEKNKVVKQ